MKRMLVFLGLAVWLALLIGLHGCSSCNGDDDDDNHPPVDDDTVDDDTVDDDTVDDDTVDDDTVDDDTADDDEQPPYDTALCAPLMETFYVTCHFQLELNGEIVDQAEATQSCEDVGYLVWPCLIDCYIDFGSACIDLYQCATECNEE